MTTFVLALVLAAPPAAIAPTRATPPADAKLADVLAQIEKQSGIRLDAGPADANKTFTFPAGTFWEVTDALAAATGTRVSSIGPGRTVKLTAGPALPTARDGAFRVTAKTVTARADLESGRTFYDVALELAWEPRFPVFRVDASPRITSASDDRGTALTAAAPSVKSPVAGYTHPATVRLDGLARQSTRITTLSGEFIVTAAPKMLAVSFDDLSGALPWKKERDGVAVAVTRLEKLDDRWEIDIGLAYPPGHPTFESFESWASGNRLTLVPPGGKPRGADSFELNENGRAIGATYRFKGIDLSSRAGWRLVYDTPAPLVEFPVRFELKDVRLP